MEARRDVFQAIADPTRRQIIGMIARQPMNLNAIAGKFNVTRQAVSLHVRVLTECGLLEVTQVGRERFCAAKLDQLDEVSAWVDQQRKFWTSKLDALERFLHTENQKKIKTTGAKRKSKRK